MENQSRLNLKITLTGLRISGRSLTGKTWLIYADYSGVAQIYNVHVQRYLTCIPHSRLQKLEKQPQTSIPWLPRSVDQQIFTCLLCNLNMPLSVFHLILMLFFLSLKHSNNNISISNMYFKVLQYPASLLSKGCFDRNYVTCSSYIHMKKEIKVLTDFTIYYSTFTYLSCNGKH